MLPALSYAYDALDPYIDARTMEIHHTKHHQAYIDNLNKALEQAPEFQALELSELLVRVNELPESIRATVQNNGGGHINHTEFWKYMSPKSQELPYDNLLKMIERDFGSFEQFKVKFENAAKSRFGSGWAWLAVDQTEKLIVVSTPNQDTVLPQHLAPLLGLDVWEHAYYLKYQNRRADYISAWWNVVNWAYVQEQLERI